jgi:hypothetical protein
MRLATAIALLQQAALKGEGGRTADTLQICNATVPDHSTLKYYGHGGYPRLRPRRTRCAWGSWAAITLHVACGEIQLTVRNRAAATCMVGKAASITKPG